MPRSAMRSPSRCRNTSPRDLAMSRMPILSPSRLSGRARRGRIVGLRSEVGSSNTVIFDLLAPSAVIPAKSGNPGPTGRTVALGPRLRGGDGGWLWSDLLGYGKAAARTAHAPAADDAGEHAGIAAGADDHQSARTELVDGAAGLRGQTAPVNLGDRNLAQAVELFIEPHLGPARISEGAVMLGR